MTTHASTFPTPQWRVRTFGNEWTKPGNIVSNGAYVLTEHIPMETATVRERNTMYWNDEATILDKVVTLVINDENTLTLTRYLAGETDKGTVPSGQYLRLKVRNTLIRLFLSLDFVHYYMTFNLSPSGPEAFKDVRVRHALVICYLIVQLVTEKILTSWSN